MSLVDGKYIEKATRGRHGARYIEKHTPEGRPYMWMSMTYTDLRDRMCKQCNFNPFFAKEGKCPKCGGELES